ncbi:MAG: hypothetical protein KY464_15855 [Gemmatimonadetes bacterium]|nr:hypothetical protein [Gemmatimonadota bacterium]
MNTHSLSADCLTEKPTDLTAEIDRGLEALRGVNGREATERYGFGREAVTTWRRRRERGEPILEIRKKNRAALNRLLRGDPLGSRIPGLEGVSGALPSRIAAERARPPATASLDPENVR